MKKLLILAILGFGLVLTGCYHAQITTGKSPSGQTVERAWAHGWLFGLVPPSVTNVAQECPNGVARVETMISFANGLASMITFNLYTPMSISVTCASGSAELPDGSHFMDLAEGDDPDEAIRLAITEAAEKSRDMQQPVYVNLR